MDRPIEKRRGFVWSRHWPVVAGAALLATVAAWLLYGNHAPTLRVPLADVTVATVVRAGFKDYVRTNGHVTPIQVVQVAPEEGGVVTEKVVEEGASVSKGDVIVRLSNSSLDLQILNAEAELAEKQNMLRNTQVAMQQDRLNNLTEQAQTDMDSQRKQRAFEQNRLLYGKGLISREEYVRSEEDFMLSQKKSRLIGSRLRQDSIYRSVQMEQMEDNLRAMRQNVMLVRARKERLEVRSAIDGEVGLLDVELGQSIQPGQKIGQINDLSAYKVEAMIDEHYIDRVRPGLTATFTRSGHTHRLTVRKVYPEVRQGRFRTDFVFVGDRPDNIRTGQTYYIDLELGQAEQAVIIPRGTFFQTTGGQWIFVVDKNRQKAYRRSIRIGRQNPQHYEVLEGLEPGELVVTSGYEAFRDSEVLVLTGK